MILNHISTLDTLEKECIEIQKDLNLTISDQATEALERGSHLAVQIARTGKMMCDAKYHQDQAKKRSIEGIAQGDRLLSLPASVLNKYVDNCCEIENLIYLWCERCHRNCEKQWDWCRTIVSYAKEEMKLAGTQK